MNVKIDMDRIIEAIESDDYLGEDSVFGAEELLIMGGCTMTQLLTQAVIRFPFTAGVLFASAVQLVTLLLTRAWSLY